MREPAVHRYGADPAQFGELYLPDGAPLGTVVVIHGGFWRARYDLSLGRPLAADLAARGYAAWNLEYRRALAGGGWPATFEDVAAGIDLLATLPVDTSRVVAVGHSAGGHLAAWAAGRASLPAGTPGAPTTADAQATAGNADTLMVPGNADNRTAGDSHTLTTAGNSDTPRTAGNAGTFVVPGDADNRRTAGNAGRRPRFTVVTAVVAQAGVLALADCAREHVGGTAALDLMGGGPSELPREYRLADPIAAVPLAAPVLCLHSRGDANVPFSYSERYVAAATAAGGTASVTELHGDHFTLVDPAAPDWAVVIEALPALLR